MLNIVTPSESDFNLVKYNTLFGYPTTSGEETHLNLCTVAENQDTYGETPDSIGSTSYLTLNSHLKEILEEMLDIIVLETDAPYLTPHPYRGTKNSPSYIPLIASFISDYIGLDINTLSSLTEKNVRDVYKKIK